MVNGQAQYASNIHKGYISLTSDTVKLDSLSIIPGTFRINDITGRLVDTSAYDLLPYSSLLIWRHRPAGDSLPVSYRVYPYAFANRYFNKDHRSYIKSNISFAGSPYTYSPTEVSADKLIDFGSLDYNGNFSRGLSFGNNQSVILNSSFNMQLQGMLTPDLEVTASITDNNIPIQPEGNTQNLQQFDKIFIQLRKGNNVVIVGDFDMNNTPDYFLRYTKKAQGGGYTGSFALNKKMGNVKTHVSAGISKGKFAHNTLIVAEGNQGPYKLTGANGETFLIILANSEAVYINGAKLTRGANQDYTIDYNAGTVTFTPKRIITADLRVVVEFQYSERSYQRTMADARVDFINNKKNFSSFFNFYTEQDAKNQSQQQNLTDNQKSYLASIGDSIDKAFYTGIDTVAYDVNRILYERRDTFYIVNGQSIDQPYFVYSTDSTKAKYAITFSLVGEGSGDYSPAQNTANGRVYTYSPQFVSGTGTNQQLGHTGSYMPIIKLVTPQLHQMYTAGADYAINKTNKVRAQVAMSNNDVNLFSSVGKKNDLGFAAMAGYTSEITIKKDSGKVKEKLTLDFNYEFAQNKFKPIERYRNVEFARDFNLVSANNISYNEHIASASAVYSILNLGSLTYRVRTFIQDSVYKGFENFVGGIFSRKKYNLNVNTSYLHTESQLAHSDFIRPHADFAYNLKFLKGIRTGASLDHEINIYRDRNTDTLNTALSHIWQNYRCFIGSGDTTKAQYKIEYTLRTEEAAKAQAFRSVDRITHTVALTGGLRSKTTHALMWNLTYRRVDEMDTARSSQELKNYYLGRIDYTLNAFKGLLKSSTLYEISAGREQKVQLVYLVSPNNTGDYVWIGKDPSQPKQLSDFVPLVYRTDTSYVRSFTTTPEFYAVNSATFNEVLNINPAAVLKNAMGIGKLASKLSLFSSLQLTKKIYANRYVATASYFNPFPTAAADTNIVSLNLNNRNTLYINRLDPKIGGQIDVGYSRGRTLLTSGFENRLTRTAGGTVRWNIYKQLNINTTYTNGIKANQSDFYKTEQYRILYNESSSELSYLFKGKIRLATSYYYGFKGNKVPDYGGQYAVINTVALDFKYNRHNKTTIGAKVSYSSIGYSDRSGANAQAQYTMLEGLKGGNNFVWNIGFEQRLSGAIQLILSYDGRKSASDKPVHTGRAEIRAIF